MRTRRIALVLSCLASVGRCPLPAAEFKARIVDGLGRPLSGVAVRVLNPERDAQGAYHATDLLKLRTDENGIVHGSYDEKRLPAGESPWLDFHKDGYRQYCTTADNRQEYVLERIFHRTDVTRVRALNEEERVVGLRELLAGEIEDEEEDPQWLLLRDESLYRPALRRLVLDPKVKFQAIGILADIGVPEDLQWIARHAPKPARHGFDNRWAYEVVTAMLEPSTDAEWALLKACATGAYDDAWVQAGAVQTLMLIASPRSRKVLEAIREQGADPDMRDMAAGALEYIAKNRPPLEDRSLEALGKRVAKAISRGSWNGNKEPRFNAQRDKAWVEIEYVHGRDLLVYTATYHNVGGTWKLRGVRETMQAFLAAPVPDEKKPKK
jgi:hypothetical protein